MTTTRCWKSICLVVIVLIGTWSMPLFAAQDGVIQSITEDAPLPWFTFSPSDPKPGDLVTLDASPSQGEGGILSYQWDTTGDGRNDRAGARIRTVFHEAGTYEVTLTVHDGLGRVAKVTRRIHVGSPRGVLLMLRTEPRGLDVYIDGEWKGQTPLEVVVQPGMRKLRLKHYWLSDWETILDLRSVRSLSLDLAFGDGA